MRVGVRCCELKNLDTCTLAAWTELGRNTVRPNPFAMPQFVLPAARWLTPQNPPMAVLIESLDQGGRELIGAGCFTREKPNLFVPLPHLHSYLTLHTFRSGMLYASGAVAEVAAALLRFSREGTRRWNAIAFRNQIADCLLFNSLKQQAEDASGGWFEQHRFQRPLLYLVNGKSPTAGMNKGRAADLRRRRRRLGERGQASFRLLQGPEANAQAAQTHLELEHSGWKGAEGTSMLSSAAQTGFFHEVVERFGRIGAALFAETLCDNKVIASESVFVLGDTVNFFKVGWHPEFAAVSPSRLNTLSMLEKLPALWPKIRVFDSQSREHDCLTELMHDRATMVTGTMTTTRTGRYAMRAARAIRPLAYRFERD